MKKTKKKNLDLMMHAVFYLYTIKSLIITSSRQTDRDKSLTLHD